MQNNQLDYHYRVIPHITEEYNQSLKWIYRKYQQSDSLSLDPYCIVSLVLCNARLIRSSKIDASWGKQKYLLRCQAWMIVCESLTIESYMNILPHIKIWYLTQECQWWHFNHKMWPNAKHEDELVSASLCQLSFYDLWQHETWPLDYLNMISTAFKQTER